MQLSCLKKHPLVQGNCLAASVYQAHLTYRQVFHSLAARIASMVHGTRRPKRLDVSFSHSPTALGTLCALPVLLLQQSAAPWHLSDSEIMDGQ